MLDEEATAPTLAALADSAEARLSVPSAAPRLVASVWPRPHDAPETFLHVARPLLNHQHMHPGDTICVLADYQLLLSGHELVGLTEAIYDSAAALLALGVDPRNTSLCRESDIASLPEIYWLLSCVLRLPPPGVEPSPARRGEGDGARERSLFLAALTVGLGATNLVLDSASPEPGSSFEPMLREVERRLGLGQDPAQVSGEGEADRPALSGVIPDLRLAGARYDAIRHNTSFLRDILSEGALAASAVGPPTIARLREYLHLGDGGTSRS
jgi:hypothetical protein